MSKLCYLSEKMVVSLIVRYDGMGKPLTEYETQLLLFALYCESEKNGELVAKARKLEP